MDKIGKIVGHVGANFAGEISWLINVYLKEEYRGKGILGELYKIARNYYPLAATAAKAAGLSLFLMLLSFFKRIF